MGATALLLDGHWAGSGDWGGLLFVPSVDEMQEFKVQTSTFSPQYGWSMGNAVNAVTKSGTAAFHGGLFEFVRNGHLDANNWFSNRDAVERPLVKRNQFGFNFGGPLWIPGLYKQRDRTFVFGSYEGLRQQTPVPITLTMPTVAEREGDFSRTFNGNGTPVTIYDPFSTRRQGAEFVRNAFPDNRIPQEKMDPVALRLLAFFPLPNRPGIAPTGQQNFAGAMPAPFTGDQYTIRVDHNVSENQRLFARWSQKRQGIQGTAPGFGADNPAGPGQFEPNPRWDIGLGNHFTLTPKFMMNVTLGWGRWVERIEPQSVPFQPSSLGLPAALDAFGGPGAFPRVSVQGLPRGLGESGVLQRTSREARTLALDFTRIQRRHTLTFGFMGIDFRQNSSSTAQARFDFERRFTQGPDPNQPSGFSGSGIASLLLGTGSGGGITYPTDAALQKSFLGWYFNDDFKLRRNLTVNLGIRYDFQTAPTERFDRLTYWTLERNSISDLVGHEVIGGLRHTGGGNPRGVYDPQYTNVAPRIGLTWSPLDRLVARAGFGMFYMPAMEMGAGDRWGLLLAGFTQETPYVGTLDNSITPQDLLRSPFPNGLVLPSGKTLGDRTALGQSITTVERHRPTPYVEQWMFGLQYQLDSATMLEANYVGNHGVKLLFGGGARLNFVPFEGTGFYRNTLRPELLSLGTALLERVPNPFFGVVGTGPLAGPTVPRAQLLRPYPQYDQVIATQTPAGMSNYNAFTLAANRRFSRGLQFQISFTASKYLTNTEGPEGAVSQNPQAGRMRNYYDISPEKSVMNNDIPRSLVISYIYELPVGNGRTFKTGGRFGEAVLGGWQVAGISTFKSGYPLSVGAINNNSNSLGGFQRPDVLVNPTLDNPTPSRWFDTAAFAQPAAFTFGNAPRTLSVLRTHGVNNFDFTAQKYWNLRWIEHSRLQFRTEFFNLFNRTSFYQPRVVFGDPTFGQVFQALPARSIQLGLKFYW